MNGTEQKDHRTVTREIAHSLEVVANTTAQRLESHGVQLADHETRIKNLGGQSAAHYVAEGEIRRCCQERWDATAQTTKRLADNITELRERGFWSRLNWLITGR